METASELGYAVIDCDNHYYEPDDCFSRHIDPRYREDAVRLGPSKTSGMRGWYAGDRVVHNGINLADGVQPPGAMHGFLTGGKELSLDTAIGDFAPKDHRELVDDRTARLKLMDEQGVEAIIMLPSMALGVEHDISDPQVLCANYQAFNRWLEEDWGLGTDHRIFSVPMISLRDIDWAIQETERLAGLGSRLIFLKTGPVDDHSPADPIFDRFWSTVSDTDTKIVFHGDVTDFPELYGKHWSEDPSRPMMEYSALQQLLCLVDRPIFDTMAALVLHNLFGRFPKLQVACVELGASWVPWLLDTMDKSAKWGQAGPWLGGKLDDLPSEIFKQHVTVAPYYEDPNIEQLVELLGVEHVVFGSDFPHPEGLAVPAEFANGLKGLSNHQVRRIMRDNAAGFLGLRTLSAAI
jgi:predicted TIM-barrel fold metal-dependent hydrolase